MCDMITLSMFDAMSRKSTELPSLLTLKIASPCPFESAGVAVLGGTGVNTSPAPVMCVPRLKAPLPPTANSGARISNAVGAGLSAVQPTRSAAMAPKAISLLDM
jgi:hypothetical protein